MPPDTPQRTLVPSLLAATLVLAAPTAVRADGEPRPLGWSRKAELNLVSTRGNSETDTLGLSAVFERRAETTKLTFTARALRASSTTLSRRAVGPSPDEFDLVETSETDVTAEQYSLGGRFESKISEALFWHASLRWERNEPAGLRDRVSAVLGVGNSWWDEETSRFRTDYGVTYTSQDDIVQTPGLDDTFFGAKLSYDYWRRVTPSTEVGSALVVDHNLDESEDLRGDLTNWIEVDINDRLAVKVSLQVLYDNLPSLGVLPLEFPPGTPTGETVSFELDDTDTVFTTALTVEF